MKATLQTIHCEGCGQQLARLPDLLLMCANRDCGFYTQQYEAPVVILKQHIEGLISVPPADCILEPEVVQ